MIANLTQILSLLPTLTVGHDANLKCDADGLRIWLSRLARTDGAPFPSTVNVEEWNVADSRWESCDALDGNLPEHLWDVRYRAVVEVAQWHLSQWVRAAEPSVSEEPLWQVMVPVLVAATDAKDAAARAAGAVNQSWNPLVGIGRTPLTPLQMTGTPTAHTDTSS